MSQFHVLVCGVGQIGQAVGLLLSEHPEYRVTLIDKQVDTSHLPDVLQSGACEVVQADIEHVSSTQFGSIDAVVCCLPFQATMHAAILAKDVNAHFFDLTEDSEQSAHVASVFRGAETIAVTQCGLAPGFTGSAAMDLLLGFSSDCDLQIRVGAIPVFPSNRLRYNLTWSVEGLVNEYIQECQAIVDSNLTSVQPLEGYELFFVEWEEYEAFNTAGGCGSLHEALAGSVASFNYKTVRYKGHRDYMLFLLDDMRLRDRPEKLCALLRQALPTTTQDKVIVWMQIRGTQAGMYRQTTSSIVIHGEFANGVPISAIQYSTASGVCVPLDIILKREYVPSTNVISPFHIPFSLFMQNRFAKAYADWPTKGF